MKRTTRDFAIIVIAMAVYACGVAHVRAQSSLPGQIISGSQRCWYNSSGTQYCSQICTNPICLRRRAQRHQLRQGF
jgi:hypothetical protein